MEKIDWVEIPKGSFMLGLTHIQIEQITQKLALHLTDAQVDTLKKRMEREIYGQLVDLDTFYISRFPITNMQYAEFALSNHHYAVGNVFVEDFKRISLDSVKYHAEKLSNHPAITHWHFAMAFCDWVGARLPTSLEWEKSSRGVDGRLYPWGDIWSEKHGHFSYSKNKNTSRVDKYPLGSSPYGVMDTVGNTYEWTMSTMIGRGASGKISNELVVCRGCSYDFHRDRDETTYPSWFRNRITTILLNEMHFGGASIVGFRPVLDQWQKKAWAGFSPSST